MSTTITDTDTCNVVCDEPNRAYNLGPPATSAIITNEFLESSVKDSSNASVSNLFLETVIKEPSKAVVSCIFWETMVSVNRYHQYGNDSLDISLSESIRITSYDSIDITIIDKTPGQAIDIWPKVIPELQPYVLLYIIGRGFSADDKITFNGVLLPTTFVDPQTITAKIPAKLITPIGTINVTVS